MKFYIARKKHTIECNFSKFKWKWKKNRGSSSLACRQPIKKEKLA